MQNDLKNHIQTVKKSTTKTEANILFFQKKANQELLKIYPEEEDQKIIKKAINYLDFTLREKTRKEAEKNPFCPIYKNYRGYTKDVEMYKIIKSHIVKIDGIKIKYSFWDLAMSLCSILGKLNRKLTDLKYKTMYASLIRNIHNGEPRAERRRKIANTVINSHNRIYKTDKLLNKLIRDTINRFVDVWDAFYKFENTNIKGGIKKQCQKAAD